MRIFQESPHVNGGNRFIFQSFCSNFFTRAIGNGQKTIQTDKNLDRYIDQLSADSGPIYRTAIFWLSSKCWSTIDRVLTKYRPTITKKSAKCRWTKSYIDQDTSGMTIDRVSTECRPTIDRYIDRLSTECRPTIDRVSTKCRPLYWPIAWSTLLTVNMIRELYIALAFVVVCLFLLSVDDQKLRYIG